MKSLTLQPEATLPQQVCRQIVRFWTEPMRAEPLAAMRIAGAVVILLSALCSIAPNLADFWLPGGLLPVSVGDEYIERTGRLSVLFGVTSPAAIITWFIIWMLSLLFVAAGFYTRIACVIAWALTSSFNLRAPYALNGGDDVAGIIMFYLMISPCGAAWSIDSLRRRLRAYRDPASGFESPAPRPRPEPVMIDAWAVRLIQIQLVAIYFFNGISKLRIDTHGINHYFNGEAVYWVLNDVTLARFSYASLPAPLWICAILSWATLLFELGFPLFILFARTRKWLLWGGVLFHLGIFITMEIGWFGQMTVCLYPIMLSGAVVAAFAARLAGTREGKASPAYVLYYDTFCPVCRRSRLALEILDVGKRIEFRDIHDRQQMQRDLPQVTYAESLKEMMVVSPSGKMTRGFDAFRTVARVLPALWLLWPWLYLPGISHLGRKVYRWVAKNRFRLVTCDVGICNMHLRALSHESLDEAEIAATIQQARQAAGTLNAGA